MEDIECIWLSEGSMPNLHEEG